MYVEDDELRIWTGQFHTFGFIGSTETIAISIFQIDNYFLLWPFNYISVNHIVNLLICD